MKPSRGDIFFAIKYKGTYLHYGIYVGGGNVIHYRTQDYTDNNQSHAKIIETTLQEFAHGSPVYREPEREGAKWDIVTVRTAKKMLGSGLGEYNLINNNCEHFANYCKYGKKESFQISRLASRFKLSIITPPLIGAYTLIENYVLNNYMLTNKYDKIDIC